MGLFNVLNVDARCPRCNTEVPMRLQFKFGTTDLFECNLGDEIRWEGEPLEGHPSEKTIVADAEREDCPNCGGVDLFDPYYIYISNNSIKRFEPATDKFDFVTANATYLELDG